DDHREAGEHDQRHDDRARGQPTAQRSTVGRGTTRSGTPSAHGAHWARTADLPNSPCGLTESTSTSATKNTSGAHVGDHMETTSLITSMRIAAAMAPPMLPSPPRITIASSREIRS